LRCRYNKGVNSISLYGFVPTTGPVPDERRHIVVVPCGYTVGHDADTVVGFIDSVEVVPDPQTRGILHVFEVTDPEPEEEDIDVDQLLASMSKEDLKDCVARIVRHHNENGSTMGIMSVLKSWDLVVD